jgi:hypothetical protein
VDHTVQQDNAGRANIFEVHKQYDKDFFVKASKGHIKPTQRKTESFFHVKRGSHGK